MSSKNDKKNEKSSDTDSSSIINNEEWDEEDESDFDSADYSSSNSTPKTTSTDYDKKHVQETTADITIEDEDTNYDDISLLDGTEEKNNGTKSLELHERFPGVYKNTKDIEKIKLKKQTKISDKKQTFTRVEAPPLVNYKQIRLVKESGGNLGFDDARVKFSEHIKNLQGIRLQQPDTERLTRHIIKMCPPELKVADYNFWTTTELKNELKKNQLSIKGDKQELISRFSIFLDHKKNPEIAKMFSYAISQNSPNPTPTLKKLL